ncbi:MAG TPA: ROK family protein [Candidatus Eisenbacteria bacterium]|jgi:glucokinase
MDRDWVIALDLGGTDLKAGLVDRAGTLAHFTRRPSRTLESAEAPLEVMGAAGEELRAIARGRAAGVGLGSPGVIHPATGALVGRTPHLPHWDSLPLGERLAARLGLPVRADNDANCAALAESTLGAARGTRTSITVTLGTGVGCGIVAEGRVLHGAFGGAGELGHLPLGSGRYPCLCGIADCVEPEASASGLIARAREAGLEVGDAAAVFAAAARGDVRAVRLVDRMADRLGALLAVAVNLVNPEAVVVGGGVAQAGEPLFARLRRALERYALASHRDGLRLLPAELGERAGVIGAGLLGWQEA